STKKNVTYGRAKRRVANWGAAQGNPLRAASTSLESLRSWKSPTSRPRLFTFKIKNYLSIAMERFANDHWRMYILRQHIWRQLIMLDSEVKRGSTEMLIMALIEERARHGYEIAKLIEERSDGVLQFHVASLYPLLYRMEKRGLIEGRWVEKAGQRRRRYYKLTAAGKKVLAEQRQTWSDFFSALDRVAKIKPA